MPNPSQPLSSPGEPLPAGPSPGGPTPGGLTSPRAIVMAIVCAGIVLVNLDLFIVNVALPAISHDLGGRDLGALSWVLSGYAIVYASLLVLFGRLADRHSLRNGFLLGIAVFALASAACAAASSVPMLIAFRVVQAAGAALLTPTSLSLVLATSPPDRRGSAVRAWTAVGGLAAALGPVIGGLLVAANWRWVFLVNIPIAAVALVAGRRWLPEVPGHRGPRPDALGALLVTGGVGALTLALVEGHTWGWGSTATIVALAGSALSLAIFAVRCLHHEHPLVPPSLFRARAYTGATFVATLFSIAFGGMLLSIVLWAQDVWGFSALQTGLAVAPGPLMVPLCSFLLAGRAIARFGPAAVGATGAALFAAGALWWTLAAGLAPDYTGDVLGGMLLTGAGVGLTLPTYLATATGSLPPTSFATGSGVINMLRQLGLAIGVAILVAVLQSTNGGAPGLDQFRQGWMVISAVALASAVVGAVALPRGLWPLAREASAGPAAAAAADRV